MKKGYKLKLPKAVKVTKGHKIRTKSSNKMPTAAKPVKDIVGGYKPKKQKSQALSF